MEVGGRGAGGGVKRKEPIPFFPSPSPRDFTTPFPPKRRACSRADSVRVAANWFWESKEIRGPEKKWHSGRKQKVDKLVSCGLNFAFKLANCNRCTIWVAFGRLFLPLQVPMVPCHCPLLPQVRIPCDMLERLYPTWHFMTHLSP